jgi:hemolysin III
MSTSVAAPRPMLRGWSHAIAVPPAIAGAITLVVVSGGDAARRISLAVYGTSLVLLFAVSATYHRWPLTARSRGFWRRLDHAMIFVAIAGTYTPVVVNVLQGWPSPVLLTAIWVLAGSGVIVATLGIPMPRGVTVGLYIAVGWTIVFFLPALAERVHAGGLVLLGIGAALYSAGAIVYALRWPRLWPGVFGYHEAFHVLVIAASSVFFVFIAVTVG